MVLVSWKHSLTRSTGTVQQNFVFLETRSILVLIDVSRTKTRTDGKCKQCEGAN